MGEAEWHNLTAHMPAVALLAVGHHMPAVVAADKATDLVLAAAAAKLAAQIAVADRLQGGRQAVAVTAVRRVWLGHSGQVAVHKIAPPAGRPAQTTLFICPPKPDGGHFYLHGGASL